MSETIRLLEWAIERTWHILRFEGVRAIGRRMRRLLVQLRHGGPPVFPLQARSLEEQYRAWLHAQELRSRNSDAVFCSETHATDEILISVVVMNSSAHMKGLRETLASIMRQRHQGWEVIITCPPSLVAGARKIFEDFKVGNAHRVHIVEAEGKFYGHFSKGVPDSSGVLVWVLRAGDVLDPEALHSVADAFLNAPETDMLYCDEDRINHDGVRTAPFFKPSWSPDLFLSTNYLSYSTAVRRPLLMELHAGKMLTETPTQYDCLLRLSERSSNVVHIPKVLYHAGSPQSNGNLSDRVGQPETAALQSALRRRGIRGSVEPGVKGRMRIRYELSRTPLVTIIIPTRDRVQHLSRCLAGLNARTSYSALEVIVLDNGSEQDQTKQYLAEVSSKWRVLSCPGAFNYSALNNRGAKMANGELVLFLNDDTEVCVSEWLTIMVEHAMRPQVGAVGAKLLFPDGRIQHAGVVLGVGGTAGHAFRHQRDDGGSYCGLADMVRNCSAVTGACMMVPRSLFMRMGGFDEQLPVEFNDVDLCLRLQGEGYRIVYTPDAVLYHYENATRQGAQAPEDEKHFRVRWAELLAKGDPYYNPNLTLRREDWSLNV